MNNNKDVFSVKKEKLTKEQKEFLDNNYKGAVNIGDKIAEIARKKIHWQQEKKY
jgi:ribosomal protein L18